ncbi:MAG: SRPBCC family protein [Anaerolineae bacterium]|nr:SRPBCC family protein [Anaerolineae bacterium]
MGHVEKSSIIHAPVAVVWDTLNDIAHTPEWVVGLENSEITTEGPYGLGTIYIDYNRLGPFLQETPWHVTAFEPMTFQVHESKSATLPTSLTLSLMPVAEATRLTMTFDYHLLPVLGPVGRLLERLLMNRLIGQVVTQNMAQLDSYLQRQRQPASSPSLV